MAVLRTFPHPYRCAFTICSDLDETPDRDAYWEIVKFLNGRGNTAMGPGLGLEIGNTVYFDMAPGAFAYWTTDDRGRAMLQALIRSGHVDCLHSYGDLALTRTHAGRALDELARHGCRIKVWVDHATAPTNFGADIMRGQGDVPGSPAYHADLTMSHGVRHVWRGRVTSIVGQGAPRRWAPSFDRSHALPSLRALGKEWAKVSLANVGHAKYGLHADNELMCKTTLRDGHHVNEFIRCNPHWDGVTRADAADDIPEVITPRYLDALESSGGTSILYTHLGKSKDPARRFSPATVAALRELARRASEGRIFVTTTARLLEFQRMLGGIGVRIDEVAGNTVVRITRHAPDLDLSGLTIELDKRPAAVEVDGRPAPGFSLHTLEGGRVAIAWPWVPLELPDV